MANTTTSGESAASALSGAELVRAVQSGANVKTTTGAVALFDAATVSIASSATPAIGAAAARTVLMTGTVTITGFDTVASGIFRKVRFGGALVLTYNATNLILPTSANITTAADDVAEFWSLGSGNWICTSYNRKSGVPLVSSSFTGGTLTSALNEAPTVTIASSSTPAIGAAAGNTILLTGTVTVTGFDTIAAGAMRRVRFGGILTLTYNATSLILPTSANITTAADDVAEFLSLGSGNWICTSYSRKNGSALVGSSVLTTKGDLQGYSSVAARIPVGVNGLALVADSAQTLGLKWGDPLGWFNVKTLYGALGDGRHVADAVTNSTTTLTSATAVFTAGDVGKIVEVSNGTTVNRRTIATFTNSTTVVLNSAASFTATSVKLYVGTDDTAAIQSAIDAAATAGGGTVFFPTGIYIVDGALQDTSRSNAQLLLPRRGTVAAYVDPITIALVGAVSPASVPVVATATGITVPTQGSIIKGTLNTTGGTAPCMIGAWGPVGSSEDFTTLHVVMRNLTVRMSDNPVLTAVDLGQCISCDVDGLDLDAGSVYVPGIIAQTTTTSYALKTPKNDNGAATRLAKLTIVGFYNGISVNEHVNGQEVFINGCKQAAVFLAGNHASRFARLCIQHCNKALVFTGGIHATHIDLLNIEHAASGTWVPTNDVDDASDFARGTLHWHAVLAGTGAVDTFTVSSAKYIKRQHLDYEGKVYTLTDAATVTIDCNIAESFRWTLGGNRTFANPTDPWGGMVINIRVLQDGTGTRTWTLGSKFKFAGGLAVLSTPASSKDFVSCQYDATDDTWNCALSKAMA